MKELGIFQQYVREPSQVGHGEVIVDLGFSENRINYEALVPRPGVRCCQGGGDQRLAFSRQHAADQDRPSNLTVLESEIKVYTQGTDCLFERSRLVDALGSRPNVRQRRQNRSSDQLLNLPPPLRPCPAARPEPSLAAWRGSPVAEAKMQDRLELGAGPRWGPSLR